MCYFILLIFSPVLFSHHKYSHQRTIMLCSCLLSARASHLLPVCQLSAPTSPPAAIRIKMLWTCRPLLLADLTRRDSPRAFSWPWEGNWNMLPFSTSAFFPPVALFLTQIGLFVDCCSYFLDFRSRNESENSMFGFGAGQYSGSGWLC